MTAVSADPTGTQQCGRCALCRARSHALCHHAGPRTLLEIAGATRPQDFPAGRIILSQGEPDTMVGIITRGIVRLSRMTEEGQEKVLALLHPGDMIGHLNMDLARFSFSAATAVTICVTDRARLEAIFLRHPGLERVYTHRMMEEMEARQLHLLEQQGVSAVARLWRWLAAQPLEEDGVVYIDVTRKDLAALLAMTPETFCRALYRLEAARRISILAPDRIALLGRRATTD